MTPDEALSIVDTKAAGRLGDAMTIEEAMGIAAEMEAIGTQIGLLSNGHALVTLAAEVQRLRERMPRWEWEWEQIGERIWRLFVVVPGIRGVFIGNAVEYFNGTAHWQHADDEISTPTDNIEEAKRQLIECAQAKCQKP